MQKSTRPTTQGSPSGDAGQAATGRGRRAVDAGGSARGSLSGSRIRERRLDRGITQARLAEICDISPSYLNLIEHNRRNIGGRLLNRIATALGTEVQALTLGADLALLDRIRDAAAGDPDAGAETGRADELAGRFPGWARLTSRQADRIGRLERTVEMLDDRLTHDPQVAEALHEMLSSVTAVTSAAAILVGEETVDLEWQARFHRNIHEDAQRLAIAAAGLIGWLDAAGSGRGGYASPAEEVEAWLGRLGHHIPDLERALVPDLGSLLSGARELTTEGAREMALAHLRRYARDARAAPLAPLVAAVTRDGPDPARLAARFGVDVPTVFRRLASLPRDAAGGVEVGLVTCDASGTVTLRKEIPGFPLPRFGAACPLLPLYQALTRPMVPIRAVVEQAGRTPQRFDCYAIAHPAAAMDFDGPALFQASMLILPGTAAADSAAPVVPVGTTCRVCPREGCPARREPSILTAAPPGGGF